MMNILIVFREDDTDNLFVPILCDAIRKQGIDVRCSLQAFWEPGTTFDLIHFQWPEEVVGWNCGDPSVIDKLKQRIDFLKSHGCRFIYTRHNLCPHYANEVISAAYRLIESCSDTIVHMARCSYDELRERQPGSNHVIIPHHLYEQTYDETLTCAEARRILNIPDNRLVITSFGKFRNLAEIMMVLKAFLRLRQPRKYLLAPRMFPFSKHPKQKNVLKRMASLAGYHILMPLLNRLLGLSAGANEELISNDDLPAYLAAADVVLIQRKQILNSGNVPLAFLFRKVAVGTETGNVGELLRETGNPTFDAESLQSVTQALEQAAVLSRSGKGEQNYVYATEHFSVEKIARMYAEEYRKLIH